MTDAADQAMPSEEGMVLPEFDQQETAVPQQEYSRARVTEVVSDDEQTLLGTTQFTQKLKVKFTSGSEKDKEQEIEYKDVVDGSSNRKLKVGDTVVVAKVTVGENVQYDIIDRYRTPQVAIMVALFVVLVLLLVRLRGVFVIAGLGVVILALWKLLVPQLLANHNPLFITVAVAVVLAVVITYLSHGISKRSSLALSSAVITLIIAGALTTLFVWLTKLFGLASEETVYIQNFYEGVINLKGLLLSGIILATLGVIVDIASSQTKFIQETAATEENTSKHLYRAGMKHGRERITSLINTLFLVYAGLSLPLFLLFSVKGSQPSWILFNSEFITEEIVRTIVGSISLLLALPIATCIASYYYGKRKETAVAVNPQSDPAHSPHDTAV